MLRVHEAGHAVAACLVGWRVEEIRFPDGGPREAECVFGGLESSTVLDGIVVKLAGVGAEALFGPFHQPDLTWAAVLEGGFPTPGGEDLVAALELANDAGVSEADLDEVWSFTLETLRHQRPAVERVAALLRDRRVLTGEELRQALAGRHARGTKDGSSQSSRSLSRRSR